MIRRLFFGKLCTGNNDAVLDIINLKYEPVKVGSNLLVYERTAKRFPPVYVRLEAVGHKVKLAQGESTRVLLAVPREMWLYRDS